MKWVELSQKGKQGTKKYEKVLDKLIEIDRSNTARMEEIVSKYGWPTFEKVGEEASNVAWLIVQHADRNPFFQERCLKLLEKELENKQINPSNYAYLYDRVQLARGDKQLYATQSTTNSNINAKVAGFQPIEDEANVQKRREEMNIKQHIEHYALSLNFNYTLPSKEEAIKRAKGYKVSYKKNIEFAKAAMAKKDYKKAADFYIVALYSDGYTNAEDCVEAARALSLSNPEDIGMGSSYLMKAIFKGYKNIDEFNVNPDFKNLKESTPDYWENDLMKVVNKIKNH